MTAADPRLCAIERGEVYAAGLGRLVLTLMEHWMGYMLIAREALLRGVHSFDPGIYAC